MIGRRETVGHPELFATTRQFLLDLGLNSLDELPSIGPREDLPAPDFELFDGQTENLPLDGAPNQTYLSAIDQEHAKLEEMALPLMQAVQERTITREDEQSASSSSLFEENIDERNNR